MTDGVKGCNISMNRTRVGWAANSVAIERINCVLAIKAICSHQHPEMTSSVSYDIRTEWIRMFGSKDSEISIRAS